MTLDWLDQTRIGRMRAFMVSPTHLDMTIGEIEGVDWSASTISAGYYSATRTSASLRVVDGNWMRNTFIRLVYEIPEWDYEREIGTYLVSNDNAVRRNGVWTTTLELHSMLFALDAEKAPSSVVIQTDTSVVAAIKNELQAAGRAYTLVSPLDFRFSSPTVLESGQTRLTRMYALCSASSNRLDVTGHGEVVVAPYVTPASKAAKLHLSLVDNRGIVSDGVERSTNWLEVPNQALVKYRFSVTDPDDESKTYDDEIVAVVSASASAPNGSRIRGYNVTHYQELTDMTPPTHARAQEIAQRNLANNSKEQVEWTLTTKFIPVWEGDVITLDIPDGLPQYQGRRHCLVKNIDLSGPYWDMKLTLKETASGGDDDD